MLPEVRAYAVIEVFSVNCGHAWLFKSSQFCINPMCNVIFIIILILKRSREMKKYRIWILRL